MIPEEALWKHIGILGKTGSGKSNLAKIIAEKLLAQGERVCVIDPTGTWWGLRLMADGSPSGHQIVILGGEHGDVRIAAGHGQAVANAIGTTSTAAVIDTRQFTVSDRTRFHGVRRNADPRQPRQSAKPRADRISRTGYGSGNRGSIRQRRKRAMKRNTGIAFAIVAAEAGRVAQPAAQ